MLGGVEAGSGNPDHSHKAVGLERHPKVQKECSEALDTESLT